MKVWDGAAELDASFKVAQVDDQTTLTIESRGGSRGAPNERNIDYGPALTLLLERLGQLGAAIVDAQVVSRTALMDFPDPAERRLPVDGGYPVYLSSRDPDEVRLQFGRAQRVTARDPSFKSGGNNNKRVRFWLSLPTEVPGLEHQLAGAPDPESSAHTAYVYVPVGGHGAENLARGIEREVWGFKASAIKRAGNLEEFRLLRPGDLLCMGHRGPSPRVPAGGWGNKTLGVIYTGLITEVGEEAEDPVWSDDLYPFRLHFTLASETRGGSLNGEGMEALRRSANERGRPVVTAIDLAGAAVEGALDGDPLRVDGPLDRLVLTKHRVEQARMRQRVLGQSETGKCDLCEIELPVRHLRIAHIKKRSLCSEKEKLDPANILVACIECDGLFEAGDILVGPLGTIVAGNISPDSRDLRSSIARRTHKPCAAFDSSSAQYFEFHRNQIGGAPAS